MTTRCKKVVDALSGEVHAASQAAAELGVSWPTVARALTTARAR